MSLCVQYSVELMNVDPHLFKTVFLFIRYFELLHFIHLFNVKVSPLSVTCLSVKNLNCIVPIFSL